ncbi:hypothetical protein N9195_02510, partial [bacterium]|nr:hypothetical protein [bacterium]
MSEELVSAGQRILVPCAGGRHSRRALKLANALSENGTVAFQVIPEADELSNELGHQNLRRIVK